jgi:hypothetical protein
MKQLDSEREISRPRRSSNTHNDNVKVEALFAELKGDIALRRLRDQFFLTGVAQISELINIQ